LRSTPPATTSETPELDASLLLALTLGISREALLASSSVILDDSQRSLFMDFVVRRAAGRPLAYLAGKKEFWGRDFTVDETVLVPRPDTELLVELGLEHGDRLARVLGRPPVVHECCAGSGAVAVTLAAERPEWLVSASDISKDALGVARANAERLLPVDRIGGPIRLVVADLLATESDERTASLVPSSTKIRGFHEGSFRHLSRLHSTRLEGPFDLILANPPYVESILARELAEAWGEPLLALDGGRDGLDLLRRLLPEAAARLVSGGILLVEADPSQAAALRDLFSSAGFVGVETRPDLAGNARVTLGALP
jgi:release factor glutamine methyltransferase